MTTNRNNSTREGCGLTATELFNVILVYEDQASARRGLALYQRLVTELGDEHDFNLKVWKFAVLGVARLAEISTAQAAEADLIIVCTRDESESSEQSLAWLQHWLEQRGNSDCAVVVLGGAANDQPAPAATGGFFHHLARRGDGAVLPPVAAPDGSRARVDGRVWLPRSSHAPGIDGWFHAASAAGPMTEPSFPAKPLTIIPSHERIPSSLLGRPRQ